MMIPGTLTRMRDPSDMGGWIYDFIDLWQPGG